MRCGLILGSDRESAFFVVARTQCIVEAQGARLVFFAPEDDGAFSGIERTKCVGKSVDHLLRELIREHEETDGSLLSIESDPCPDAIPFSQALETTPVAVDLDFRVRVDPPEAGVVLALHEELYFAARRIRPLENGVSLWTGPQ